jgi:membrane-bound lytic murein transglycosylase B
MTTVHRIIASAQSQFWVMTLYCSILCIGLSSCSTSQTAQQQSGAPSIAQRTRTSGKNLGGLPAMNPVSSNNISGASALHTAGDESPTTLAPIRQRTNYEIFSPVIKRLYDKGADSGFVNLMMNDARTAFHDNLVKVNVIGQPKKASYVYTEPMEVINRGKKFLAENRNTLLEAERKYHVSRYAIMAILWVETKFGDNTGKHHVPSVYLSVAMADQPEFVASNKQRLRQEFEVNPNELTDLDAKIESRARTKAKWAVNELLALQRMMKVSPLPVMDLRGSWAGAFGFSQFLPSSYLRSAVDGDNDGKINLFDVRDAIYSIGNYLQKGGWGKSEASHKKAVYSYNRSDDYVKAVLGLSKRFEKHTKS